MMNREPTARNLVLVGFMGTGKSTVAALVAQRLGRDVVEMDAEIEKRVGEKIAHIFAQDGESHFRKLERALVQELAGRKNLVISAGGGIAMNPDNMKDFNASGTVICLTASPGVILKRVGRQSHRPLLEGDDKARKILELLEKRRPLYESIPLCIDTSALSPQEVADRVVSMMD